MKKYIIPVLLLTLALSACEKDDPVIPNEEELITTLIYRLEPLGAGEVVELKFVDLDGDGGDAPIITTSPLQPSTTYQGSIMLLNELEEPAEDITEEVEEEGDHHQLFYVENVLKTNVEYLDQDLNGNPVGLLTSLETGGATTGTLTIILRHQPNKPNNGTPEDAGGETDIEVTFNIIVE